MTEDVINPLTPEQAKTWVEALRSGEYQQTKAALCEMSPKWDEDGCSIFDGNGNVVRDPSTAKYCCLGVLNKIIPTVDPTNGYLKDYGPTDQAPKETVFLLPMEQQREYAQLNDGGSSFSEIADRIEEDFNLKEEVIDQA